MPPLSVIIACVNGSPAIEECLAALAGQAAEVIVADVTGADIRTKFPWAKVLPIAQRLTIPQLRAIGLAQSRGDIIAIIEDHCNVAPDWCERIVQAHTAHPDCVAIGGVVENGSSDRLVDWAVFFCEYSRYMPPLTAGQCADITGNNVSYKRAAFAGIDDATLNAGFWESTLHPKLLARGEKFFCDPAIVVRHKKSFGFGYFVSQRYHYSRYYAGTLTGNWSVTRRWARGVASLALPVVLLTRIASRVKSHRKELLLASPLLAVFTLVWAWGEVVGCFFGPGRSLERIE